MSGEPVGGEAEPGVPEDGMSGSGRPDRWAW